MRIPLSIVFLSLIIGADVHAQDTLLKSKPNAPVYPVFRNITIQKSYFGDADYKLFSKEGELQREGELSEERVRISAIIPLYSKNQWGMAVGAVYTRENLIYFNKSTDGLYRKEKLNTNDVDATFSVTYTSMLFKKPVVYGATVVLGSTNLFDVKKISGFVSSALVMKATPVTVSTLGLILNVDQSSLFPLFPLFSYWHRFDHSLWELDAVLPQKVMLRRSEVLKGWFSTGIEFNGSSFFTKQDQEMQYRGGNYEWISNELYFNAGYEHMLGKNFVLGVKGGYRTSVTTRLVRVNETINDYKSTTKIGAPFFNVNLSFLLPKGPPKKKR